MAWLSVEILYTYACIGRGDVTNRLIALDKIFLACDMHYVPCLGLIHEGMKGVTNE